MDKVSFEKSDNTYKASFEGRPAYLLTVGVIGIGGYVVYKVVNNVQYVTAIIQSFLKSGALIQNVRFGSLLIDVVAENNEVADKIRESCQSGNFLKQINENLDKFEEEFNEKVGRFENIKILKTTPLHMSQKEWENAKIQYQKNIKEIFEKGIKPHGTEIKNQAKPTANKQSDEVLMAPINKTDQRAHASSSEQNSRPVDLDEQPGYEDDTTEGDLMITSKLSVLNGKGSKLYEKRDPKLSQEVEPKSCNKDDTATSTKCKKVIHPTTHNFNSEYAEILRGANYLEKTELTKHLEKFQQLNAAGKHSELFRQGEEVWKVMENVQHISTCQLYQKAIEQKSKNNFSEAVLFFYLAFCRATNEFNSDMTYQMASLCLRDIADVTKQHVAKSQKIATIYVVPVMLFIFKINRESRNKQEIELESLWCAHWMALGYILTEDWNSCELTLTEVLPEEKKDLFKVSKVVGYCYTNLAYSHFKRNNYDQTWKYYTLASRMLNKAEDFVTEKNKKEHILVAENALVWWKRHVRAWYDSSDAKIENVSAGMHENVISN